MSRLVKVIYLIIGSLIGAAIVVKSLDYFESDFSRGFLIGKKDVFPYYQFALYAHIIGAPLAFFTGVVQFLFTRSRFHQQVGKVYVFSVILLAAPSGLFMSFFAIGGIRGFILFFALSSLWLIYTWLAYRAAKAGEISMHRRWITGSFILANSAILLRIFSLINNSLEIVPGENGYLLASALSWIPWIVMYELWGRYNSP